MTRRNVGTRLAIAIAGVSSLSCAYEREGPLPADPAAMSFFITSASPGSGDLDGLAGADAQCLKLAQAAGSPKRQWRAYLSAPERPGQPAVHARDRIGRGPWLNARGVEIAGTVDELHSEDNGIGLSTALDERGGGVHIRIRDILTGSNPDGTLAPGDATCRGWTSTDGYAMVGHHNEGGGTPPNSWNSAHISPGCSMQELDSSGGAGRFYCFAAD